MRKCLLLQCQVHAISRQAINPQGKPLDLTRLIAGNKTRIKSAQTFRNSARGQNSQRHAFLIPAIACRNLYAQPQKSEKLWDGRDNDSDAALRSCSQGDVHGSVLVPDRVVPRRGGIHRLAQWHAPSCCMLLVSGNK
jgi:hypothetical protein